MKQWFFFISPFWGEVKNFNQISFRVFQFTQDSLSKVYFGSKSISGKGKGAGFEFMDFKENWQILYVNFTFSTYPNSDQTQILNYFQKVQTKSNWKCILSKIYFF